MAEKSRKGQVFQHPDSTIKKVLRMIDVPKGRMKKVEESSKKYKVGNGVAFAWMKDKALLKRLGIKMNNPPRVVSRTLEPTNVSNKVDSFTELIKKSVEKTMRLIDQKTLIEREIKLSKIKTRKLVESI